MLQVTAGARFAFAGPIEKFQGVGARRVQERIPRLHRRDVDVDQRLVDERLQHVEALARRENAARHRNERVQVEAARKDGGGA